MNYVFDIDGTLTDIRKPITKTHKRVFLKWARQVRSQGHEITVVTGSDYEKAREQIGKEILGSLNFLFTCHGGIGHISNGYMHKDILFPWFKKEWRLPARAFDVLFKELERSYFFKKTGNHLEDRIAMYNFSIPGRNASPDIREAYIQWDTETGERQSIADKLNQVPGVKAIVGGKLGIDIMPLGLDKSIIVHDKLISNEPIVFFCNEFYEGGTDYELGKLATKVYNVKNFKETYERLQNKS